MASIWLCRDATNLGCLPSGAVFILSKGKPWKDGDGIWHAPRGESECIPLYNKLARLNLRGLEKGTSIRLIP